MSSGIITFTINLWYMVYKVSTKRNANFLMTFFGVKIIDCKNDSISVVLPFNKELCSKVLS